MERLTNIRWRGYGKTVMDADLGHVVERHGTVAAIYVSGVLDYSTALLLRRDIDECAAANAKRVELHLGEVGFIDSSGLGALIHAYKVVPSSGKELVFLGDSGVVSRLLKRTALDRVIKLVPETNGHLLRNKSANAAG
jgi:anti-anti-sigma factor